jgi:hypothetical protein
VPVVFTSLLESNRLSLNQRHVHARLKRDKELLEKRASHE